MRAARARGNRGPVVVLLVSVFVVAACGLVYELVAGALASYLLGDSVLQFSTIIGAYLFAMGIGSWLSRFIDRDLAGYFIRIEVAVGLIGGFTPMLLFLQYAWDAGPFRWLLYGLVFAVGTLVGLELPLVMRLLRDHYQLKELVSQVMTVDYLGALAVSLAFPLIFLPMLGMMRTGLFFGLANVLIACWALWIFKDRLPGRRRHIMLISGATLALGLAFAYAGQLTRLAEAQLYGDRIVFATQSPYQRLVLTRHQDDLRFYLNGNLQFSSIDEYRYHEALVVPALAAHRAPKNVLLLGAGDGLAAQRLLRHPGVERITLVDLDQQVTSLFSSNPQLIKLNGNALNDPRLTIINADAHQWMQQQRKTYDLIYVDLPDPSNAALNKLYTRGFFELLGQRLSASGFMTMQATSPLHARRSYWMIVRTLEAAGFSTSPYHAVVPSFGEWGFVIASTRPFPLNQAIDQLSRWQKPASPMPLRFLSAEFLTSLFAFAPDMSRVEGPINRLFEPLLVDLYEREWGAVANAIVSAD